MNDKQIQKMISDMYDDKQEDTIRGMVKDFYSRKNLSTALIVWIIGLIFAVPAVYCGIGLFRADNTQTQLIHATIFIVCIQNIALMKIFAWQMIHKNRTCREIKRLEIRIAELTQTMNK